ncbi:helix-turn-helix transcriptional regulator [Modestobacter sp. VKM Ac-2978]|uniref:helix-turn-helix transcriptional regulator n=1 Tax=Modestobacter sp. VKM Ac-2978 TaxID=3004132 RepID=UPI0022AAA9BC|nr:WYL domain-containing protein [Modestobacter sp. VKM Ac-2978]MCZ2848871.1 WYL domain-containing protein [Modestobacter sp. VKM Ac-2978]
MRADRLVAGLLVLQARGRVTAAQLAAELEVSVATARRDLEALSAAGIPVYPQPGRGGGWSLVGGARTDLTGLTEAEAAALFLLLGPAAQGGPAARTALRKLVRALPGPFREGARAAAEAVVVDGAGWGGSDHSRPPVVELLQQALVRRRRLRLGYPGRDGVTAVRVVDPWGLDAKGDVWYLLAGTPRGRRTFRADRVVSAELTDEPAQRPAELELAAVWEEVVAEMEGRRSAVAAAVLVPARLVPVLQALFGRHCTVGEEQTDGRVALRVAAHTARSVAEQLAGLGGAVEVVEPVEVRTELTRIGAELVARHSR